MSSNVGGWFYKRSLYPSLWSWRYVYLYRKRNIKEYVNVGEGSVTHDRGERCTKTIKYECRRSRDREYINGYCVCVCVCREKTRGIAHSRLKTLSLTEHWQQGRALLRLIKNLHISLFFALTASVTFRPIKPGNIFYLKKKEFFFCRLIRLSPHFPHWVKIVSSHKFLSVFFLSFFLFSVSRLMYTKWSRVESYSVPICPLFFFPSSD